MHEEIFAKLSLDETVKGLLEEAVIERIKVLKSENQLTLYVRNNRLLPYELQKKLQEQIQDELFHHAPYQIELKLSYQLSEQYSPEKLWQLHHHDFLTEIKEQSIAAYAILHDAKSQFSNDELHFTCEDNAIARSKTPKIKAFLEKIFAERFGYQIVVQFDYTTPKPPKLNEPVHYGLPAKTVETVSPKETIKPTGTSSVKERNPAFKSSKYRKNSDPDIFFGRAFEGEAIPISDIQAEINDVVIRGKIIKLDSREIGRAHV